MSSDKDLDCTNCSRGIWLVKVPKYISERWAKTTTNNMEVGKLAIVRTPGSTSSDIKFTLSDSIANMQDSPAPKPVAVTAKSPVPFSKGSIGTAAAAAAAAAAASKINSSNAPVAMASGPTIPTEHQFYLTNIKEQTLAVFSQTGEKVSMEGKVVEKADCRPIAGDAYMKLKKQAIMSASKPMREVKQLDRVVNSYKPVSDHRNNIEFEQMKKTEGKKSREDKDKVLDMLYAAFEKHQYYNIRDLVKITRQPVTYLKEILGEICNYNLKAPHRCMWELKPEYRHYKVQDGAE